MSTKRKLTAEQIAKRDERRARFKDLWNRVAKMPEPERLQMTSQLGIVTCEGRPLSGKNMILVAFQQPNATVVGGFRQWLNNGRCVKKGEHGAMIWCPTAKEGSEMPEPPKPGEQQAEASDRRFIIGTVFDISQTQEVEAHA